MATDVRPAGRVGMLVHSYYLRDARVRRQAEALAEAGADVHVFCLTEQAGGVGRPEPREETVNGVRIHRLPVSKRRGGFLRYAFEYVAVGILGAFELARLHARKRLDVVHVHNMPDLFVFAGLIPRLTGSTLILDIHDPMPELFMSGRRGGSGRVLAACLRLQERISCRLADKVISVNETMRENLEAKGVEHDKICIVHNFPDSRHFPVRNAESHWPRSGNGLVMLYSGTVTEHYDVRLAVLAMAALADEIPVRLQILGDGNRMRDVFETAERLGVRERIQHLGSVPIERVKEHMSCADLGISCHRPGVFGDLYFSTKIVEYLTQGLPVLSPRTYTVSRYLPSEAVFYFQPESAEDLAAQIRFVWENPGEVLRRLEKARELLPTLSWEPERRRFVDFYSGLLGRDLGACPRDTAALSVNK
jgi:glycosyltransferase involved in cell wall biosynthesis